MDHKISTPMTKYLGKVKVQYVKSGNNCFFFWNVKILFCFKKGLYQIKVELDLQVIFTFIAALTLKETLWQTLIEFPTPRYSRLTMAKYCSLPYPLGLSL